MKKVLSTGLLLLLFSNYVAAQKKLIERFLSDKTTNNRKTSILLLPAVGVAQETGLEFGVVSIISFYTNPKDTITRASTINTNATFTTKRQSNLYIKPDIWFSENKYHLSGTLRYKNFPFSFYGIGDNTLKANEDKITLYWTAAIADFEKLVTDRLYIGITSGFERYKYEDKEQGGIFETGQYVTSGNVFYAGPSVIYDSRNTNTYTTSGSYFRLSYAFAPKISGSNGFSGGIIKADLRQFFPLQKKLSLGTNLNYQSVQGKDIPFYLYPQLGNDQIMRGYYTGRYRDQNLATLHAELRYHFITRLGVAAFGGAGTSFKNGAFRWDRLKPNYGAGIRYFADPGRGITIRADYAFGEKRGGEARQKGFYLSFAEAF